MTMRKSSKHSKLMQSFVITMKSTKVKTAANYLSEYWKIGNFAGVSKNIIENWINSNRQHYEKH